MGSPHKSCASFAAEILISESAEGVMRVLRGRTTKEAAQQEALEQDAAH